MLTSQLITGVLIDWDKIDRDSFLRNIAAISGADHITFNHSVTFFVGENGSGNSCIGCWMNMKLRDKCYGSLHVG